MPPFPIPGLFPNKERAPRELLEGPVSCFEYCVFRSVVRRNEVPPARDGHRLWIGLLLRRGSWRLGLSSRSSFSGLPGFSSGSTKQSQSIFRIEGEAADRLFPRGAEGDIHAAVVGKAHGQQVFQDLLLFRGAQVGIRFDQLLDLLGGHVLFKSKRL